MTSQSGSERRRATSSSDDVPNFHANDVTIGHASVSTENVPSVHQPAPDGWHNDDCMPPDTATRLRLLRRERNITQDDVAAAVDCDRSMISKIEKGKPPGLSLAIKLAEFYRVSLQWLVDGQGDREILPHSELTAAEKELVRAFRHLSDAEAAAALTMVIAASKRK